MYRRGAVHWADLDKRRPVVVLSPDARNLGANDIIVVPCSTTLRLGPWHVRLARGEAGLRAASVAKCEAIATVAKHRVHPDAMGGVLGASRMREIERAVLLAIGIVVD